MSTNNPANAQNIQYDIRVVRLAKSTEQTKIGRILERMDVIRKEGKVHAAANLNVCLGHFDVMVVDQVDNDSNQKASPIYQVIDDYKANRDLADILGLERSPDQYISENGSYCPIYMLLQKSKEDTVQWKSMLNDFWMQRSNYTIIMRLHQVARQAHGSKPFRMQLVDRLISVGGTRHSKLTAHQDSSASVYVTLNGSPDPIRCVFYDSMELGDVVGVLKGNSLRSLLEVQRWLYEAQSVSSAYSYCGVRYDLLNGSGITHEVRKKMEGSRIDYVETRFSVKSTDLAWNYLRDSNNSGYFVTGSVDALVHYLGKSEFHILKILSQLISYRSGEHDIYDLFHDVVTRVGLRNRQPIRHDTPVPGSSSAYPQIPLKKDMLDWLAREYANTNHPDGEMYAYSLEKLVSSLNAMSANSVTDALSQLMYRGIKALIEQLEHYWKDAKKETLGGKSQEWDRVSVYVLRKLQEFLDEWNSATNEILHLESQLFQHPELIPVRFYIPAMILQFQMMIVEKAMEAVRSLEGNTRLYTYVPIMLPRSQEHTTTTAIFDPKEEPGYGKQSPLCIRVPIHLLYHPYRISLILCHEIAHYCGNEIRHREVRNNAIFKCMSFYAATRMIQSMDLLKKEGTAYDSDNPTIRKKALACTVRMEQQFRRIMTPKVRGGYLEHVISEFTLNIPSLIQDSKLIQDLVYTLLGGFCSFDDQIRISDSIRMEGYTTLLDDANICLDHLETCIEPLFKECFADIVMILLTNCSFRHYYLRVIHDDYLNLTNRRYKNDEEEADQIREWRERHTNRMALVAMCINQLFTELAKDETNPKLWLAAKETTELEEDLQDLDYCIRTLEKVKHWAAVKDDPLPSWDSGKDLQSNSYALAGYEAREILIYLVVCALDIHKRIHSDEGKPISQVRELRDWVSMLKGSHMDWDALQRKLYESRSA